MRKMDFWDDANNKGRLSGPDGNRVKPLRLRGIFSEGVLYPVTTNNFAHGGSEHYLWVYSGVSPMPNMHMNYHNVVEGQNVADLLGIAKYEPIIPNNMAGEVANMFGYTAKYDFERLETIPDMFEDGEQVTATEKIHGTMVSIAMIPGLSHDELFGSEKNILVHSKGLGAQGLVFKNNDANLNNIYVKNLRLMLDAGFEENLKLAISQLLGDTWSDTDLTVNSPIRIFGEIYGPGVQDLHYGEKTFAFRVFDVKLGDEWLDQEYMEIFCSRAKLNIVPIVYRGPFNIAELEKVRDGRTEVGGDNIREGVVVRADAGHTAKYHPYHGRKIAKMISPDYLLRKSKNQTEYQ